MKHSLAFLTVLGMGVGSLGAQSPLDFDRDVAPILADRCLDCHSGVKPKGGLDLSRKATVFAGKNGPAIVATKPDDSSLWQRVDAGEMPPKKPLPASEKAILKRWIESGAKWGSDPIDPLRVTTPRRAGVDWWALRPVKRPAMPAVKQTDWPRNPIDHFVLAKLEAEGLAPSPPADARTLSRRLHFGLTGLPPTPDARAETDTAAVVERLLKSPNYGERWARHWLDVVRFGESNGFEHDEIRNNAWRYRDWVIDAFNRDLPYDEFARLQIAGDVLPGHPDGAIATGFLVAGGYDTVGQSQQSAAMKAVVRQDELEDIVGTIGQTFLGLTVQCARCHDHKFDPVRIEEYYRLTAAVAGVRHGERTVMTPTEQAAHDKAVAERQQRIDQLQRALAAIDDPVRRAIEIERGKGEAKPTPRSIARWDFTRGLADEVSGGDVVLHGDAKRNGDGLVLSGAGYASTHLPGKPLAAKTLSAVVKLRDITQRGGAAISIQSLDGNQFDAIVFGERVPGRWMAGSDTFVRTKDWPGPADTEAANKPVHIAITYHADGTIAGYRNSVPLGEPYKAAKLLSLPADQAMVVFGLRHTPAALGRYLSGTVVSAEVFDRALSQEEVAALTAARVGVIGEAEIVAKLDEPKKTSRAELKKSLEAALVPLPPPGRRAYAVTPKSAEPTYLLIRGNPGQRGPEVAPGGVAALNVDFEANAKSTDAERRKLLAEWIASPKNPLFARVMVNRLWHYHFGVGLVDSPSDFGFNGGRPSHPELLDWLADEFIRSGYSVKHMQRLIVNSATYRQSSKFRPDAAKRDADNRWLWRHSPNRLEAEAARDAMLSVAGQLDPTRGGPGYRDFRVVIRGATHYYPAIEADSPEFRRRSIYRTATRGGRNALLDTLDCPDPSATSPRRAVTTTPLQALSLLNSAFVLYRAEGFALRLKKDGGDDPARQIARAYELAYGRPPTGDEIAAARSVVEQHGLAALCRAFFNSSEFLYVD
jgi:hypothetical protein